MIIVPVVHILSQCVHWKGEIIFGKMQGRSSNARVRTADQGRHDAPAVG